MDEILEILDEFSGFFSLLSLAIAILMIAAVWKILKKAGMPGFGAIIPIYNVYLMLKLAGRPGWWLFLYLIPIVDVVVGIIVAIDIARSFGKDIGFAVGLIFLPFIFYPILGFGKAQYTGPILTTMPGCGVILLIGLIIIAIITGLVKLWRWLL